MDGPSSDIDQGWTAIKGLALDMPNLAALASPVTVQLHRRDDPVCWGATYSGPPIKQDATQYEAKAD